MRSRQCSSKFEVLEFDERCCFSKLGSKWADYHRISEENPTLLTASNKKWYVHFYTYRFGFHTCEVWPMNLKLIEGWSQEYYWEIDNSTPSNLAWLRTSQFSWYLGSASLAYWDKWIVMVVTITTTNMYIFLETTGKKPGRRNFFCIVTIEFTVVPRKQSRVLESM